MKDQNYEYFIDDLYCIDPQCNCEIAHLFFLRPEKKIRQFLIHSLYNWTSKKDLELIKPLSLKKMP
jgi:hypothetical protein